MRDEAGEINSNISVNHDFPKPLDAPDIQNLLSGERLDGDGTLTQQIYRLLKRLIVELRLMPNQFLSEKDIAINLEISKTPVREAFIRLSEDGMLLIVPQSGTYVAPIDIAKASEGYFVCSALGAACASRVAHKRGIEDLHFLKGLMEEQREALEHGDYHAFYAADDDFHEAMFRIAGYPSVKNLIDIARLEADRVRSMKKLFNLQPGAAVREEHSGILEAIIDRDGDLAGKRMAAHLSRVNDSLVDLVRDEKLWGMFNSLNKSRGRRHRKQDRDDASSLREAAIAPAPHSVSGSRHQSRNASSQRGKTGAKIREIRYGIVGVKGFSQSHAAWINRAAAAGAPIRLAAAATIFDDPEAVAAGGELARAGVKIVRDYDDLLALRDEIDIVTLPVGIHLHALLATKALHAGFPVYMEKPAAGTVKEVAELMAAEKKSGKRLFVGFQTLYQPSTWILKRDLLDGRIGTPRKIIATVPWPRAMSYYRRNNWAGKIEIGGRKLFDCPLNNSAAHFLNAALFLAGPTPEASAVPTGVTAELYRAAPIESADSAFCRFTTREGVDIVFNASQACRDDRKVQFDIIGDRGTIHIVDREERGLAPWVVTDSGGVAREEGRDPPRAEVFERVAAAFLDPEMREICTLANAGMHTAANQLAFMAGEIRNFPARCVDRLPRGDGDELYAVKGMNETLEALRPGGLLPGELKPREWAVPGNSLLGKPVEELLSTITE